MLRTQVYIIIIIMKIVHKVQNKNAKLKNL